MELWGSVMDALIHKLEGTLSCCQMGSSPDSRVVRGPGLCGGTKGSGTAECWGKSLPLLSNCQAGCMQGRGPVVTIAST